MTYDSLFSDISAISDYFFTVIGRLIIYINSQPLLVLAVFISVTLPSVLFIIFLVSVLIDSPEDLTFDGIRFYKIFRSKKLKKEQRLLRESFKREKEHNEALRYEQGLSIAKTFFSNNPNRMSVRVNGFTYYQDGFENKHWGNSKKTRVTKKYKQADDGSFYLSNTSYTSTETYDNTSEQLDDKLDLD